MKRYFLQQKINNIPDKKLSPFSLLFKMNKKIEHNNCKVSTFYSIHFRCTIKIYYFFYINS